MHFTPFLDESLQWCPGLSHTTPEDTLFWLSSIIFFSPVANRYGISKGPDQEFEIVSLELRDEDPSFAPPVWVVLLEFDHHLYWCFLSFSDLLEIRFKFSIVLEPFELGLTWIFKKMSIAASSDFHNSLWVWSFLLTENSFFLVRFISLFQIELALSPPFVTSFFSFFFHDSFPFTA